MTQLADPNARTTDPVLVATRVFDSLTQGRRADKYEALKLLDKDFPPAGREYLRERVSGALAGEFERDGDLQEQEERVTRTRRWLLSALGRLTESDGAEDFVEERISRQGLDEEDRCWALEGLIASGVPGLEALVRGTEERERAAQEEEPPRRQPLVRALAMAYLASQRDGAKKEELLRWLGEGSDLQRQWAALLALVNVPVKATVDGLCEIVETADEDDSRSLSVYRAIRALGSLADTLGPQAKDEAAATLMVFVRGRRGWPVWDEARARALAALGDLGGENAISTLTEELTDENPAVACAAARALRGVAGTQIAVARVVEAMCKLDRAGVLLAGRSHAGPFAGALRWMEDYAPIVEELEAIMVSGPSGQQEAARMLLSEIGGAAALKKLQARKMAMDAYTSAMRDAEEKIRDLFDTSINEARDGFKVAVRMDVTVFVLGVVLVITSAVLALLAGGDAFSNWAGAGVTGTTGVLGILYGTLIAKPREQVQAAVDHLMYLKVVFLAYLRQLHQADQAYTRHLVEDEEGITLEELDKFSTLVERTMNHAVSQLNGNTPNSRPPTSPELRA